LPQRRAEYGYQNRGTIGSLLWRRTPKGLWRQYYVGGSENSEQFGWYLWWQACRHGLREATETVYLGDGAPWVRPIHQRHFRQATFIVDWYHAQKHIWDCAKLVWGEGHEQTAQWADRCCGWLWEGWIRKLLSKLTRRHKHARGRKRDALEALPRYISTNEEQMRYDVFREQGYSIGSGMMEGGLPSCGRRSAQGFRNDPEPWWLIGHLGVADLLAQQRMG